MIDENISLSTNIYKCISLIKEIEQITKIEENFDSLKIYNDKKNLKELSKEIENLTIHILDELNILKTTCLESGNNTSI
ncbi:hypothetical protein [Aliarcobacter lanthieri]|uniref:hypothetical protein n=1 Tax=Aliarcobacter lanthieri TaxID=1355374 RepID=UPI000478B9CD|nr:hypothetical protein [Aliarcobacter lanthieri]